MNTTKKNISMWQYAVYASVIILIVCGLTFIFSSCTEELPVTPVKFQLGKKITVHFSLDNVNYGENSVITRSQYDMNPETVVVPLDGDLCMVATLEADQPVRTRAATSNLAEGTQLRIVAYWEGENYQAHADYTVTKGILVSDNPLQVYEGNYKFVVYSFNSTTDLPDHNEILKIDPSIDLLWGCYPATGTFEVTSSTHENVPITISHRFSQMTVVATTEMIGNIKILGINTVTITPGKKVNLSVRDSILIDTSDATQNVSSVWTGLGTSFVSSQPRTVYTNNAEAFQVNIGSLTLDGLAKPFTNLTATFSKQLKSGVSYTVRVYFRKGGDIVDDTSPNNFPLYVGAFWKHDQTGERLIRIARPTTGNATAADGAWTATVVVGNDWIVLDREMTTDPNVGWRNGANEARVHNGNDSGFDFQHPVNSTLRSVGGILRAQGSSGYQTNDDFIYFRIGLTGTLPNYPAVPARYGMILLTYKNNSQKHRIWIRQGEGADYLMHYNDAINSGNTNSSTRPAARKFSPYNLTKEGNLDAAVPLQNNGGGSFSDYPTKAGAFFQWAHAGNGAYDRMRYAWNPHLAETPVNWNFFGGYPGRYWNTLADTQETCPPGYHRPNDGSITGNEFSSNVSNSEMRQSLFKAPIEGFNYASDVSNSIWGYYADGFFDRRQIVDGTKVSANNRDVAYIGRLFFNSLESSNSRNASLFFPAAGARDHSEVRPGGTLSGVGIEGAYWSASKYEENSHKFGSFMRFMDYSASAWIAYESFGYSIRCVKD